jgi:hypothetical protein
MENNDIIGRNDFSLPNPNIVVSNPPLPPNHRIWERVIDVILYISFLVIALIAAIYHIEEKSFWIAYTVVVVGVLGRSRGKLDPETVLKLVAGR